MTQNKMQTTLQIVSAMVGETAGVLPGEILDDQQLFYDAGQMSHTQALAGGTAGLDSLDRVELTMMIEEEFSIEVPDGDVNDKRFETIAGIAAYIDERLGC